MQFVFLLLFNVFLGAVLYLVISLKLERSATEFRERRFRKEMDEIIKEFNITAERNISLLESRIRQLRKLLEKGGDIRSLDITLDDGPGDVSAGPGGDRPIPVAPGGPGLNIELKNGIAAHVGENNGAVLIKKGLLILFEKFIDILTFKRGPVPPSGSADDSERAAAVEAPRVERLMGGATERSGAIIEKDMTMMIPAAVPPMPEKKRPALSEDEIGEIVAASEDRYKLVSILSEGGCCVEEISRYSGIPAGEVRLVLNLNRSRGMSDQ